MNNKLPLYGVMFLAVFGYTAYVIATDGYISIVHAAMASPAAIQITLDLVAALLLVVMWIYKDARNLNSNPWPWIIGTCLLGTSVPLLYLVIRERKQSWSSL